MSKLYQHPDYADAQRRFDTSQQWGDFKPVQLTVAKYKCPICECSLKQDELLERPSNNSSAVKIGSTVDHYRPVQFYPFLKYEHYNYLLMCADCNNVYKGNSFRLYAGTNAATEPERADSIDSLAQEQPLVVNPITDDLLPLFSLNFTYSPSGKKVLELVPKSDSGYLYEKACETITLFGLNGDSEQASRPNKNVRHLRITLLHHHYKQFEKFVRCFEAGDVQAMKKEIAAKKLNDYGFFQFILNKQYVRI